MSNKKKAPVDRAVATIKQSTRTDAEKAAVAGTLAQQMAKSANWAAATDVQAAVKAWTSNTAALGSNAQTISGLRAQLATAEAAQEGLRRDWMAARKQVVSTVTVFAAGSADTIKGFNLDVIQNGRLGLLSAPEGLSVNPGAVPGEIVATWTKGIAIHGFVVQHATDPNNAATISPSIPSTKPKLVVDGLSSNASVSFRVAAIDPASTTGQSQWTSWVIGNAK
jgi:hypothetical protein